MTLVRVPMVLLAYFACCQAQSVDQGKKPPADVLIFGNGDKLTGKILSADSAAVTFQSEVAGKVTIPWTTVRELQSASSFVAIPKGVVLVRGSEPTGTLRGKMALNKQDLELKGDDPAPVQTLPLNKVATVIPASTFTEVNKPVGFFTNWHGRGAFGVNLTRSTQDVLGYSTGFNAVRQDPSVPWESLKSRDTIDVNYVQSKISSYGESIDISIMNALYERDHFITPRFYLLGIAYLERNNSQGLNLRQNYGGGPGYFLVWNERTSFEVYGALRYSYQQLTDPSFNRSIFGGRFGEFLTHRFKSGASFSERATYYPAFNYEKDYFASFSVSLSVPVYKRLGVQISAFDNYFNEPPPGFKRNSFQSSLGLTYAF